MLYIDQPVQTGFSYDVLANGTIDEVASPFIVTPVKSSDVHTLDLNTTYLLGTFSSQNPNTTVDTTVGAAEVAWHFMQTWTQQSVALLYIAQIYPNVVQISEIQTEEQQIQHLDRVLRRTLGPNIRRLLPVPEQQDCEWRSV
jgi:hypothetical protein